MFVCFQGQSGSRGRPGSAGKFGPGGETGPHGAKGDKGDLGLIVSTFNLTGGNNKYIVNIFVYIHNFTYIQGESGILGPPGPAGAPGTSVSVLCVSLHSGQLNLCYLDIYLLISPKCRV